MKNILLIAILFFVSCEKHEVEKPDEFKYDPKRDHFWPGNTLRLIAGEGITIFDSGEYLELWLAPETRLPIERQRFTVVDSSKPTFGYRYEYNLTNTIEEDDSFFIHLIRKGTIKE